MLMELTPAAPSLMMNGSTGQGDELSLITMQLYCVTGLQLKLKGADFKFLLYMSHTNKTRVLSELDALTQHLYSSNFPRRKLLEVDAR